MSGHNKHNPVEEVIKTVDEAAQEVVESTERMIDPYRKTAFERFPIVFTLLTAFGAAATILAMEQFILRIEWLSDRPVVVLIICIVTLVVTGRLYKKLG